LSKDVFEKEVLALVKSIPKGQVSTYGDIAAAAGWPGYARHVGKALGNLPDKSPVPWHRVVNSQGVLRGTAPLQRDRLDGEGVPFRPDGRVHLKACRWRGPTP
jgi:methylated-DNA-protein-cysteine methyltransferase-like protein